MDHDLAKAKGLALFNEAMSHVVQGHPRWTSDSESSDKMWSTGGGNGKPFQDSCHKNPMNNMKRQKDDIRR